MYRSDKPAIQGVQQLYQFHIHESVVSEAVRRTSLDSLSGILVSRMFQNPRECQGKWIISYAKWSRKSSVSIKKK